MSSIKKKALTILKQNKILKLSFWLMAFFIPFQAHFWSLFNLTVAIQPSEIFIALFVITSFISKNIRLNFDKYDLIALTWVGLNALSLLTIGFENNILIEVAKPVELFLLYIAVRGYVSRYGLNDTIKPFIFSVVFACLLAIFGWLFNLFGVSNSFVGQVIDYPYLGAIGRAKALTPTPNMLASLILVSFFLLTYINISSPVKKYKRPHKVLFILLILASILAVSKTIILIVASLSLFASFYGSVSSKAMLYFFRSLSVFLFMFYVVASHVVIDFNHGKDLQGSQELGYVLDGVQFGNFYIAPTAYYALKKGSIEVIKNNSLFGVGPGQYNKYYDSLKEKGIYNNKIDAYDPHNTFLGAVAELGVFAGLYLIVAIVILFMDLIHRIQKSSNSNESFFGLILIVLLVSICIESIVTDIMNIRQYWYLYSLMAYYLSALPTENKKVIK